MGGGGGKGLGSRPISNILRKRVEIGRRGGEVIGGGIEMQLFKTAITEMKERGLNRGRPPGARGIYSTGFPSWKNSLKAFLPGRRAAMQTKNQTWSLAVLFLLVLFILRVSSCWV